MALLARESKEILRVGLREFYGNSPDMLTVEACQFLGLCSFRGDTAFLSYLRQESARYFDANFMDDSIVK